MSVGVYLFKYNKRKVHNNECKFALTIKVSAGYCSGSNA